MTYAYSSLLSKPDDCVRDDPTTGPEHPIKRTVHTVLNTIITFEMLYQQIAYLCTFMIFSILTKVCINSTKNVFYPICGK